ncbi:MAG TPA: hypothetical protein VF803_03185 [Candidatus Paceibacterota bacterium]
MNTSLYKDAFGWGIGLWLIGYILGFVLFAFVPVSLIGWVITPIGIAITLLVLLKNIRHDSLRAYILIACAWTGIAILLDYIFLVQMLKPADGYYKLDVYLYYIVTFVLPVAIGWYKTRRAKAV